MQAGAGIQPTPGATRVAQPNVDAAASPTEADDAAESGCGSLTEQHGRSKCARIEPSPPNSFGGEGWVRGLRCQSTARLAFRRRPLTPALSPIYETVGGEGAKQHGGPPSCPRAAAVGGEGRQAARPCRRDLPAIRHAPAPIEGHSDVAHARRPSTQHPRRPFVLSRHCVIETRIEPSTPSLLGGEGWVRGSRHKLPVRCSSC